MNSYNINKGIYIRIKIQRTEGKWSFFRLITDGTSDKIEVVDLVTDRIFYVDYL